MLLVRLYLFAVLGGMCLEPAGVTPVRYPLPHGLLKCSVLPPQSGKYMERRSRVITCSIFSMHQKSKEDDTTVEHDERGTLGVEALDMMPSYGPDGVRGLFSSGYVLGAACLASLGGFSFGYDQGVISVINVMPQFHAAIPQAESEFGKGFMTGMLLLGAFVGCIFMPYLADKVSRKWALTVVVIIFDIGAIIQTSAQSYGMLVAGRAIGGIGVGTLAMVEMNLLSHARQLANISGNTRAHHFTSQKFHHQTCEEPY